MPMTLEQALSEALAEEYRAHATYRAVLDAFGDVWPFVNIIEAEARHIRALERLCARYNTKKPVDEWRGRVAAPDSVEAACEAGVAAEIENAALYEKLLVAAKGHPDVEETFRRLMTASQENHLPAFKRGVRREQRAESGDSGPDCRPRRRRHRHRGGG